MTITKQTVADKIASYLHRELTLVQLVDWAEEVMMNGELADGESTALRDAVSRQGVADVRAFGLAWEDCEGLLRPLGYSVHVDVMPA